MVHGLRLYSVCVFSQIVFVKDGLIRKEVIFKGTKLLSCFTLDGPKVYRACSSKTVVNFGH